MVTSSFPFYKDNIPYGNHFAVGGLWNTGAKPTITVTPITGHIAFVKEIRFIASDTFAISAGSMDIAHSVADGSNKYLQLTIDSEKKFMALASEITTFDMPSATTWLKGVIELKTPEKVLKSVPHTFTITDNSSTIAGSIYLEIVGWTWLESEYDEAT